ncbi:MAG: hyaluronidase [Halioglobus sp.]|nr:hyaluronidase [Halioglobus sp.]
MNTSETGFLTGVVEGFFGRTWPQETRIAYAGLLQAMGLNSYLYCPKGDPHLRSSWRDDWPPETREALEALCRAYRGVGLNWGVGLSPMALYRAYGPSEQADLITRVRQLEDLGLNLLAILFDDMPGDQFDLASVQAQIVADVAAAVPDVTLLMCPTYYSFDPALEQHFGARPDNYWADLGAGLDERVQVLWTGNEVCAESIARADLQSIRHKLGRPVTLWDNYPVNDSASRCTRLYTSELGGREPGLQGDLLQGHFCNPMNQGLLSLPALNGLAHLYGAPGLSDEQLAAALGRQAWERLAEDASLFENEGLEGLGEDRREALLAVYRGIPGPAAAEVADWLAGGFAFDPDCLTA